MNKMVYNIDYIMNQVDNSVKQRKHKGQYYVIRKS